MIRQLQSTRRVITDAYGVTVKLTLCVSVFAGLASLSVIVISSRYDPSAKLCSGMPCPAWMLRSAADGSNPAAGSRGEEA